MNPLPSLLVISPQASPAGKFQQHLPVTGSGNMLTPSQFTKGELVRAVVVAAESSTQFTLESGTNRFQVESKTPLSLGQSVDLLVSSTGSRTELQLLPDIVGQYFSRTITTQASKLDFSSFFQLLSRSDSGQLANFSDTGLKTLQQFAQLLQQTSQQPHVLPANSTNLRPAGTDAIAQLFNQLLTRAEQQLTTPSTTAQGRLTTADIADTFRQLAQLFQNKNQVTPAAQTQLSKLPQEKQQLFQLLSLIQQTAQDSKSSVDLSRQLAQLLLQPQQLTTTAPGPQGNELSTLKSSFSELFFLLKGPEAVQQLFADKTLPGSLLTELQTGLPGKATTGTSQTVAKEGIGLQNLVKSLGLHLENRLAAGDLQGAKNNVKAALLELIQNLTGQSRLGESAQRTLNTIEFYQLMQLQLERQDALVLPLPSPLIDQGFLVIENYKKGQDEKPEGREPPGSFSLYLKLSPLGNMRIDFLSNNDGIYLRFHSESKEISSFLSEFRQEISSAITTAPVQSVSFSEGSEDPVTGILQKKGADDHPFFDIKA